MPEYVLVTTRSFQKLEGEHKNILIEAGFEIVPSGLDRALTAAELAERLPGMTAVIVGVDDVSAEALKGADTLKVISMNGIGLDRIDIEAATRRGIVVTHTPGTNSDSVADLTMALILAQIRRISAHDGTVRSGKWQRSMGHELRGLKLGLVGLGQIGRKVAKRALAFGMNVCAYDPFADAEYCRKHNVEITDLQTVLTSSDIVSLHCPATAETIGIINANSLASMKPGTVLINTARGDLVDEKALIDALTSGHIGGAGLDVFETEPPAESPLWKMDQAVLTPHLGGYTHEATLRTAYQSAKNVVAVLRGGTADRIVNPEVL